MIRDQDPDVFAIIEFRAKAVARDLISEEFTDYDFAMTDSKRQLDFLVGWRSGRFQQVLWTQRREFQAQDIDLRPGGLLSFREVGETAFHNVLVLHTDSGKTPEEYDRRQRMFDKIWRMRRALAGLAVQGGQARLIALGDMNTMGRSRRGTIPTIRAADEVSDLVREAGFVRNGMRVLTKSASLTYRSAGGTLRGDLDHLLWTR